MKRTVALLLSLLLIAGVFAGCAGSGNESSKASEPSQDGSSSSEVSASESGQEPAQTADCLYVVPGDEPKELAEVIGMVNEKMAEDNAGVRLQMQYIPWDAWDQKINIMLSTGEKFDLFQVMNDRVSLANYASRGALADITEAMASYGENITAVNPEIMMKSGQVGGVQYAIPAYWVESAIDPEIFLRTDIMKKYGIEKVPETWDELTSAMETVIKNWDGPQKPYLMLTGSNTARFAYPAKTYEEWPFVIYDKIFYVDQEGNVENYFKTDVFKKDCQYASDWYSRGIIDPDCMTTTSEQVTNQMQTGNYFLGASDIGPLKTNYPDITIDDFVRVELAPDKPDVRPYGTRNMNAVPLSSEHPEAAVKFVNWVYASQENYDLFLYGREGVDYNKIDDPRSRESLIDSATGRPAYGFDDWMIGSVEFIRPASSLPAAYSDRLYSYNENAVEGYAAQFTFDASSVQTEYADVMTVISEYIAPMACGVSDYDSHIDEALSMLDKAGADRLIEEFKKQLEESKK